MTTSPSPSGARAVARCDALARAPYSDMAGGLYRGYLTPAHAAALEALRGWMEEAGMAVRLDCAGNLIGRREGLIADAPALLIGSHIDSVRNGGAYDGALGVMLGIEVVDALHRTGQITPFPIEVIAFGDEEGSRFPAAMATSRALAGTLDPMMLEMVDGLGISLAQALAQFPGLPPAPQGGQPIDAFPTARRARADTFAYLEAHIEQGPVLEARGLALGCVTGIAAQARFAVNVKGQANHAGTTAMGLRRDALAGAAEMILVVERLARDDNADLVATVGVLEAWPGAANVIPGTVRFTLDVRSLDQARRDKAARSMIAAFEQVAAARDLACTVEPIHDLSASPCDPELIDLLDAALEDAGQERFRLVSGAGHDAMNLSALCPTAMLFIRCRAGISHNPAEHVEPQDAECALQVMGHFIARLGERFVAA